MRWQNLKIELPTLGPNGCLVNEFKCNNGECIAAEKRCDLLVGGLPFDQVSAAISVWLRIVTDPFFRPDCKDESDEGTVCSSGNHCNKNFTFQCYYGEMNFLEKVLSKSEPD